VFHRKLTRDEGGLLVIHTPLEDQSSLVTVETIYRKSHTMYLTISNKAVPGRTIGQTLSPDRNRPSKLYVPAAPKDTPVKGQVGDRALDPEFILDVLLWKISRHVYV